MPYLKEHFTKENQQRADKHKERSQHHRLRKEFQKRPQDTAKHLPDDEHLEEYQQ